MRYAVELKMNCSGYLFRGAYTPSHICHARPMGFAMDVTTAGWGEWRSYRAR